MRIFILLAGTSLLAACGGGGESVTSTPPLTGTPTPSPAGTGHTFVAPTEAKTYVGVGGSLVYDYATDNRNCCNQQAETYAGNATTVRDSSIALTYDPRDAIFTLSVRDPKSGAATNTRFQDPGSRTDFGGVREPQWATPQLDNTNVKYLQAGDGNPLSPYGWSGTGFVNQGDNDTPPTGDIGSSITATTLFYLKPGSETRYVTYAGYLRNSVSFNQATTQSGVAVKMTNYHLERGAFAYGELTDSKNVPTTGSGLYKGSMLATMIFNPTMDGKDISGSTVLPSYFQWLEGAATLNVDFLKNAFELALTGTVKAPQFDDNTGPRDTVLKQGATFAANGKGIINMVNFGGFKGQFNSAAFQNPAGGSRYEVAVEGSSIDGAFYGPNGQEAGGGFRIVGGKPDERIDILGAFVGTK